MQELERVLDRLATRLGAIRGTPEPLDGGITNRNFRVRFGERDCVVRLPGKDTALLGIDREAERRAAGAAAALGIAPAVVLAAEDCLVTEFLIGSSAAPGELRDSPEEVALCLRRFHDSGTLLPSRFWVPELLELYREILRRRAGGLPGGFDGARALCRRIAAALPAFSEAPCHNDLLAANILRRREGPCVLLDWEYAGMGHPLFDLGNLAVNNEFGEPAEERLMRAYDGADPSRPRLAALRLMRIMSDAREAAWGWVQSVISPLAFDFTGYAERHAARLERAAGDPRLQEWLDAAAA